jgi:hypothetical protein
MCYFLQRTLFSFGAYGKVCDVNLIEGNGIAGKSYMEKQSSFLNSLHIP